MFEKEPRILFYDFLHVPESISYKVFSFSIESEGEKNDGKLQNNDSGLFDGVMGENKIWKLCW